MLRLGMGGLHRHQFFRWGCRCQVGTGERLQRPVTLGPFRPSGGVAFFTWYGLFALKPVQFSDTLVHCLEIVESFSILRVKLVNGFHVLFALAWESCAAVVLPCL